MKMKVRLLSPWPASEVVVGSKMGVQMKSKMASKFVPVTSSASYSPTCKKCIEADLGEQQFLQQRVEVFF